MLQHHGSGSAAGGDARRMHKRQRIAITTERAAVAVAAATTTTRRARATTTARAVATTAASVAEIAVLSSSSTSFRPGVAASGTATRIVGDTPPTLSRGLGTVDPSVYSSFSFAAASSGYTAKAASTGASSSSSSNTAASTGLSQTALIGIIAGAAGGGVILLAVIGFCCWKRKKEKKEEQAWSNLSDSQAKGPKDLDGPSGGAARAGGAAPWASSDSLVPHGEKPWAGQSSVSLASLAYDEKASSPWGPPQTLNAARAELFGSAPTARSETPTSMLSAPHGPQGRPRAETGLYSVNDVISFSGQPRSHAAYPPSSSLYSAPPPGLVTPSPSHQHLAHSAPLPSSASSHALYPPQPPSTPQQHNPSRQPIVTPQQEYPPARPPRPSEVPSAPPSPYGRAVRAAERDTQLRDEALENRFMDVMTGRVGVDDREEEEVVQSQEERSSEFAEQRRKRRSGVVGSRPADETRRKKDTIVGLADAYAGGGEDDWAEVDVNTPAQHQQEPAPRPNVPMRSSSKRQPAPPVHPPQRSSSKRQSHGAPSSAPPVPTLSPTVESFPLPPTNPLIRPPPPAASSNSNRYSSRIDSKPLRELEQYLHQMPTPPGARAFPRVSEGSEFSSFSARRQSRISVASSVTPLNLARRTPGSGTASLVPQSGSKDSLSPLTASAASAQHSPYGEPSRYERSIYSAAGELGEVASSSGGSAAGSPVKARGKRPPPVGLGLSPSGSGYLSPLGTPTSERFGGMQQSTSSLAIVETVEEEEDEEPVARPPQSTRPPPPVPLRLARSASLANRQPLADSSSSSAARPAVPPPAADLYASTSSTTSSFLGPMSMSAAERDILSQLGLPSPSLLSHSGASTLTAVSYDSGLATPDLTRSMASPAGTPEVGTPATPVFAGHAPAVAVAVASSDPSYLDVLPSTPPSSSPQKPVFTPNSSVASSIDPLAVAKATPTKGQSFLDPLLGASNGSGDGFVPLGQMVPHDANYRSATMSVYDLY
ncbi:hypothetical protein JCM8097_005931 [Rhodosporidiobolus ruineniae]